MSWLVWGPILTVAAIVGAIASGMVRVIWLGLDDSMELPNWKLGAKQSMLDYVLGAIVFFGLLGVYLKDWGFTLLVAVFVFLAAWWESLKNYRYLQQRPAWCQHCQRVYSFLRWKANKKCCPGCGGPWSDAHRWWEICYRAGYDDEVADNLHPPDGAYYPQKARCSKCRQVFDDPETTTPCTGGGRHLWMTL